LHAWDAAAAADAQAQHERSAVHLMAVVEHLQRALATQQQQAAAELTAAAAEQQRGRGEWAARESILRGEVIAAHKVPAAVQAIADAVPQSSQSATAPQLRLVVVCPSEQDALDATAPPADAAASHGSAAPSGTGPPLTSSELSELSLKFFPELEPLLGAVPPVSQAHIYKAASVYLYDSFHCRSIKHSMSLPALRAYEFLHLSWWKAFMRWVGWGHLLLAFVEMPSSLLWNGQRLGPSHLGAAGLEGLALALYALHAVMQYRAYGPGQQGFWRSPWRTAKMLVLAACTIDVLVSAIRNLDSPGVHMSQLLRVFFVLEQSGRMRQLCSCIVKSLPAIISIMFLCAVHIFVFGSDEGDTKTAGRYVELRIGIPAMLMPVLLGVVVFSSQRDWLSVHRPAGELVLPAP